MTDITASLVRNLRLETSAGMMDCKRALQESDGDVAAAKAWLRKKGLAGAQAKAARTTDQGLVAIAVRQKEAASVLELNAETDFVARNPSFQAFLRKVARRALETQACDVDTLLATPFEAGESVEQALQSLVGTIGENMRFRRCAYLVCEKGIVATYTHGRVLAEGDEAQEDSQKSSAEVSMGTLGVLLAIEAEERSEQLEQTGKALAMHIAAAKPLVVARADLSAETVRQEEEILTEQARSTSAKGAPVEKIVKGRLEKFFRSVVLDEQKYALDETRSIASMLEEAGGGVAPARVKGFLRIALGEHALGEHSLGEHTLKEHTLGEHALGEQH